MDGCDVFSDLRLDFNELSGDLPVLTALRSVRCGQSLLGPVLTLGLLFQHRMTCVSMPFHDTPGIVWPRSVLSLSNNHFGGTIPSRFSQLRFLRYVSACIRVDFKLTQFECLTLYRADRYHH